MIQNLIQNCPGAKKCSKYNWTRFEVKKKLPTSSKDNKVDDKDKPANTADEDKQINEDQSDLKVDSSKLQEASSPVLNDNAKQDSSESDNDQLMIELDGS